jgi:hypothetical protein
MGTYSGSKETPNGPSRGGPQETRDLQEEQMTTPANKPIRQGSVQDSRAIEPKGEPKSNEGPVRDI